MPDVVFVLPCPLEPLLDDKLPHLAGPEVGEAGEVEEGEAVVYPLQVEDDETRLLPEGILGDVREGAAELRLVVSEECEVVVSSLVLLSEVQLVDVSRQCRCRLSLHEDSLLQLSHALQAVVQEGELRGAVKEEKN